MTLEQIKADSLAKGAKFFTKEVKDAYKTRYSKRVAEGTNGIFFVTSDEITTTANVPERRFAVRSFNPVSGEIELVSGLGQYPTDYAAHTAAKAFAGPTPAEETNLPEHVNEPAPVSAETVLAVVAAVAAPVAEEIARIEEAIPFPVAAIG